MYFWTCWISKRYRLAIDLTLAIALTLFATLPAGIVYRYGRLELAPMTPQQVVKTWSSGVENSLMLLLVLLLFAAADLGALAMGEGSKRQDMDFLLTRPRPRRYFVWISWLAGLSQLAPLLGLSVLTSLITLFAMTHVLLPGPLLTLSVAILVEAVAMFTLVFVLVVLTRSAQNSFLITGLVLIAFAILGFVRDPNRTNPGYFQYAIWFDSDYRPKYFGMFDWYTSPHQPFPLANVVLLLCVTLALPLIAQFGFERRDL